MTTSDETVLRRFLVDGRLVQVPAKRSKRLVVLDHVAQAFLPGHTYPEAEVDELLLTFHPDHAAPRRHLVDEGFLTREVSTGERSVYWRSGGTVEV